MGDVMNITDCEEYAKDHGFDSLEFKMAFPNGSVKSCKWLDAYLGIFTIVGVEGFVTTQQMYQSAPNAMCIIVTEVE